MARWQHERGLTILADLSDGISGSVSDYDGLDLLAPEFGENFESITKDISERCPVVRTNAGWLLTSFDDVRSALADWRTFSSAVGGVNPWRPEGMDLQRPIESDPPSHTEFRRPFQPMFAPGPVGEMELAMRTIARDLVVRIKSAGGCEVASEFARPFVGTVFFSLLLGLPAEQSVEFTELVHEMLNGPLEGQPAAAQRYTDRVDEVLRTHAEGRSSSAFLDVIASLVIDGQPAPWTEKRATLSLFIIGGLDTTVFSTVAALWHMCEHPEVRERLIADPSLLPAAVEEILRLYAPAWILGRTVTKDVEIQGRSIRSGDYVLVSYLLASRDAQAFDDPLTLDLERDGKSHLAFGAGPHRCIGAHLARLEIRVALEEFLAVIPRFSQRPGTVVERTTTLVRGVNELLLDCEW